MNGSYTNLKTQEYNQKRIPNTFGLDVYAAELLEYGSVEELESWIAQGRITAPYLHIGSGSNLLFLTDYPGMVIRSRIRDIEVLLEDKRQLEVRVGAGMVWDDFVAHAVKHRWYGAENLSHIPGEVGAAAVQNIGAYGVEIKELITKVETLDMQGRRRIFGVDECDYSYRNSRFKRKEMKDCFVTYVHFRLDKIEQYQLHYGTLLDEVAQMPVIDLPAVRQMIIRIRERKLPDPRVWGNAGSFFMNPVVERKQLDELCRRYPQMPFHEAGNGQFKIPAAWLIEQCGWKGKTLGAAAVYDKHPLVIINRGGATGQEIASLAVAVKRSVEQQFGITLHPEVNIIG